MVDALTVNAECQIYKLWSSPDPVGHALGWGVSQLVGQLVFECAAALVGNANCK